MPLGNPHLWSAVAVAFGRFKATSLSAAINACGTWQFAVGLLEISQKTTLQLSIATQLRVLRGGCSAAIKQNDQNGDEREEWGTSTSFQHFSSRKNAR